MFRKKRDNRELNKFAITFFAFVILLNIAIFVLWLRFQDNYVNYQENQVDEIKEMVSASLDEENMADNFKKMEEDYNFEILILGDSGVEYTSNGVETVEQQEEIYDEHYIYKELYESKGYQVWISVNGVDFSEYINGYLFASIFLATIIVITFTIFSYFVLRKVVNTLVNVYNTIIELRHQGEDHQDNDNVEQNAVLDNVNNELLLLISQLSLKYYNVKNVDLENSKIITYQKSLLEEQKQYLETAIHDIKTPISSMGYALYSLNKNHKHKKEVTEEISYLYEQSQNTMNMVVNTLETVRDDSLDIFIDETNVLINEIVENNFKDSELILSKRNITYSIKGNECLVYTNKIKVIQMINNITSNMIIYCADNTNMSIEFESTKVTFKNQYDQVDNKYTTKRGKNYIINIAKELDFEVSEVEKDGMYTCSIDFGEHNTLA